MSRRFREWIKKLTRPQESPRVERRTPDYRLLPAGAGCWLIAWWACAAAPSHVILAAAGCGLASVVLCLPHQRIRLLRLRYLLAFSAAACGVVSLSCLRAGVLRAEEPVAGWVQQRAVAQLTATASSDAARVGTVMAGNENRPPPDNGRQGNPRYFLRVTTISIQARGRSVAAAVPLVVIGDQSWASVVAGTPVQFTARLAPTATGDKAVAMAAAAGAPRTQPAAWWWQASHQFRQRLQQLCAGWDPQAGALLPSLAVGDTSSLSPQVTGDLQRSGLTHLTAVSGANVAIVSGAIVLLASWLGCSRRWRYAIAIAAIGGFVVLARPEPSVLRAAVMGTIALSGMAISRRGPPLPALAAAVIILLSCDPFLSRSAGFALSCAATAGLVLLVPPWADVLCRRWKVPRWLALALCVPAAAQLLCTPILLLLQPNVSLVAVAANMVAEPAVAPATVCALVAGAVGWVWPAAGHLLAGIGCAATWWIIQVAHYFSAIPGGNQLVTPGPVAVILAAAGCAIVVVATLRGSRSGSVRRRRQTGGAVAVGCHDIATPGRAAFARCGPPARNLRPGMVFVVLLVIALLLLLRPAAVQWLGRARLPTDWSLAMCDVGQGDAMVIRSGARSAIVIDTGPDPRLLDRCLSRLGITAVALLIITHLHADHIGGIAALRKYPVAKAVFPTLSIDQRMREALAFPGAALNTIVTTARHDRSGKLGDGGWSVQWHVLSPQPVPTALNSELPQPQQLRQLTLDSSTQPSAQPVADDESTTAGTANNSSLATRWTVRRPDGATVSVLGLGDLEREGQRQIVAGRPPPVDVVKVAHHGSANQDQQLYRQIRPRLALISAGRGNRYGHPAATTLRSLRAAGSWTASTDAHGTLVVSPIKAPDSRHSSALQVFAAT